MSNKQDQKGENKSPYPTQPQATTVYPQQTPYPMYNPAPVANPMMAGMPAPPPSYDQAMHHPVAPPNYNQPHWNSGYPPNQQYPGMPYSQPLPNQYNQQPMHNLYMAPPNSYQPQVLPQQPAGAQPSTVVVHNAFDAGARFDSSSQVRIPPPPPGVAPNMAQTAQASGQNVVLGQRKNKWFMGGSDGGAVFW